MDLKIIRNVNGPNKITQHAINVNIHPLPVRTNPKGPILKMPEENDMLNHAFIKKANYDFENSLGPDWAQIGELNGHQSLIMLLVELFCLSQQYLSHVSTFPGLSQF